MRLGGGGDGATQPLGRDPPFGSGTWRGCSQGGGEGKCQCSAAALEQELGPGVWQGRALRTPHSWECVQQLGTRGGERHDPPPQAMLPPSGQSQEAAGLYHPLLSGVWIGGLTRGLGMIRYSPSQGPHIEVTSPGGLTQALS